MTADGGMPRRSGSVTSPARVPIVLMNAAEARAAVDAINEAAHAACALILELEEREGWRALVYTSWRACAATELQRSVATVYRMLDRARVERNLAFSHGGRRSGATTCR
jgi:hypothetical protein